MAFEKEPVGQTRIVQRNTKQGASVLEGLSNAVGSFFGQQAAASAKKDAELEAANQKAALAKLSSVVRSRSDEAKLALKTGDYSNLIGAEMASRVAIQKAAPGIVGGQLGAMQDDEIKNLIQSVPEGASPDAAYSKWVRERERDLTPAAAVTFRAETDKFAQKHIMDWQKKIQAVQAERQLDRAPILVRQAVKAGAGLDDFDAMTAGLAGMMGGNHVENHRKVRKIIGSEVIRMMVEPEDKGLSMRADKLFYDLKLNELYTPEEIKDIQSKSVSQYKSQLSVDFIAAMDKANLDFDVAQAEYEANPSSAGMAKMQRAFHKGMSDMLYHGNEHTRGVKEFRAKAAKWIKGEAQRNAAYKDIVSKGMTNIAMSPKDKDFNVMRLENSGNMTKAIKFQADTGSSKRWQQQHDRDMLTPSAETKASFNRVRMLRDMGPLSLDKHFGDKKAMAVFAALDTLEKTQGLDAALAQHSTILEGLKEFSGNTETFFEQRIRELNLNSTRAKQGVRGARDTAQQFVSKWGEEMGLGDESFLALPAQTQDHLMDILNLSSIITTATGGDGDMLEQTFKTLGAQRAWEYIYVNGEAKPIPRRSPDQVLGALGQPIRMRAWGEDSAKSFKFFAEEKYGDYADDLGYTSDAQTRQDGSMVLTDQGRPLVFQPNRPVTISAELYDLIKDQAVLVHDHADGLKTIRLEGDTRMVNERIKLEHDIKGNLMSLRVLDRPDAKQGGVMEWVGEQLLALGIDVPDLLKREEAITDINSLEKRQGETAVRELMEASGRFWSESNLRGKLRHKDPGVRETAKKELARREANDDMSPDDPDAVAAYPGLGTAWRDPEAYISSFKAIDEIDILMEEHAQAGLRTEMYTPDAARPAAVKGTIEEKIIAMQAATAKAGGKMTYRDLENVDSFDDKVGDFIFKVEGFSAKAYPDNGFISIGHGYNLTGRPQARKEVESIGLDYDKLVKGEATVTEEQAQKLGHIAIAKLENWMRETFEGVTMEPHRWMALLSMAYNSAWSSKGPTLIGPNLRRHIRNGDWEAAANEIEFKSIANDTPKHLKRGLMIRRKKEAALFRGAP